MKKVICLVLVFLMLPLFTLDSRSILYEDYRAAEYQAEHLDILVGFNIISSVELNKGGYMTNLEALTTIYNLFGGTYDGYSLARWERDAELAAIDYFEPNIKIMLSDLFSYFGRPILKREEILDIKLDQRLTNYQALVYVTRMIGNTYSCIDKPEELAFTERSQTYQAAYDKGIIDSISMVNADAPILRKDFYRLIHKALFVVIDIGGYASSKGRFVDTFMKSKSGQ